MHPMDKNIPKPQWKFAQIHPTQAKESSSALHNTQTVY